MTITSVSRGSGSEVRSIDEDRVLPKSSIKMSVSAEATERDLSLIRKSRVITIQTAVPTAYCELRALLDFLIANPACDSKKEEIEAIKKKLTDRRFPDTTSTIKRIHHTIDKRKTSLMDRLLTLEHQDLNALLLSSNASFDFRFIELAIALKKYSEGKLVSELSTLCLKLIEIGLYRKVLEFVENGKIDKASVTPHIASYFAKQGRVQTALSYIGEKREGLVEYVAVPLMKSGHMKKALQVVSGLEVSSSGLSLFFDNFKPTSPNELYPELLARVLLKKNVSRELNLVVEKFIEFKETEAAISFLMENEFPAATCSLAATTIYAALADEGAVDRMMLFSAKLRRKKISFVSLSEAKWHLARAYTISGHFSKARHFILKSIKNKKVRGRALYFLTNHLFSKGNTTYPLRIYRILVDEVIENETLRDETHKLAAIALVKKERFAEAVELINRLWTSKMRVPVLVGVLEYLEKGKAKEQIPIILDGVPLTRDGRDHPDFTKLIKYFIKYDRLDTVQLNLERFVRNSSTSECCVELAKEGFHEQARKAALLIESNFYRNDTLCKIMAHMLINGEEIKVVMELVQKDFNPTNKDAVLLFVIDKLFDNEHITIAKEVFDKIESETVKELEPIFSTIFQLFHLVKNGDHKKAIEIASKLDLPEVVKGDCLAKISSDLFVPDKIAQAREILGRIENKFLREEHIVQLISQMGSKFIEESRLDMLMQLISQVSDPVFWNQAIDSITIKLSCDIKALPEAIAVLKEQKRKVSDTEQAHFDEQKKKIQAERLSVESKFPKNNPIEWS